ncbi:MAG: LPS export ABC transporter periplasmic protein LptC [Hyphomicrobiales bacterium]
MNAATPDDEADNGLDFDVAPPPHFRVSAALTRRKRFVSLMSWTCGVVMVFSVATFLVYAGLFEDEPPDPETQISSDNLNDTLNVGELQFTGFDKKNQSYNVSATSAQQDKDKPNVIYLDKVRAEIKIRRSGDIVIVTSDRGTYDTETEVMVLKDDIKMLTTNGYTANLKSAKVWLDDGRVESSEPVVVNMSDGTIWSNGIEMWDDGKRIRFTNRVRVLFQGRGTKTDAG